MAENSEDLIVEEGQAPADLSPEVGRFVGTVLGSPSLELGELVAEEFRAFRFKRHIRHVQKAQERLAAAGMEAKQVPTRMLAPLLEGGSVEDDEELADRWSSLLANAAADSADAPPVSPSFAYVLRELDPQQVLLMERLFKVAIVMAPELRPQYGLKGEVIAERLEMSKQQFLFNSDNLRRLGLVYTERLTSGWDQAFVITEFGMAFVRACQAPSWSPPALVYESREQIAAQVEKNQARWAAVQGAAVTPESGDGPTASS